MVKAPAFRVSHFCSPWPLVGRWVLFSSCALTLKTELSSLAAGDRRSAPDARLYTKCKCLIVTHPSDPYCSYSGSRNLLSLGGGKGWKGVGSEGLLSVPDAIVWLLSVSPRTFVSCYS